MRTDLGHDRFERVEEDHNAVDRYVFRHGWGVYMAYLEYYELPAEWNGPIYLRNYVHDEWVEIRAHEVPPVFHDRLMQALEKVRHGNTQS